MTTGSISRWFPFMLNPEHWDYLNPYKKKTKKKNKKTKTKTKK